MKDYKKILDEYKKLRYALEKEIYRLLPELVDILKINHLTQYDFNINCLVGFDIDFEVEYINISGTEYWGFGGYEEHLVSMPFQFLYDEKFRKEYREKELEKRQKRIKKKEEEVKIYRKRKREKEEIELYLKLREKYGDS